MDPVYTKRFFPVEVLGLEDLFLILRISKGACSLLTLVNIWRNLERLSLQSLLFKTNSQFSLLRSALKAILLNFLKFLYSILSGKGLLAGSYTIENTGKWSAISTAILPLVQTEAKFEWIIMIYTCLGYFSYTRSLKNMGIKAFRSN